MARDLHAAAPKGGSHHDRRHFTTIEIATRIWDVVPLNRRVPSHEKRRAIATQFTSFSRHGNDSADELRTMIRGPQKE